MTRAQVSAEIAAPVEDVWAWVSDPRRWPRWDVSFSHAEPRGAATGDHDAELKEPFALVKAEADRTINFTCQLTLGPGEYELHLECTGGSGESLTESFSAVETTRGAETTLTRQTEYRLMGQNLGVVSDTTYIEASVQRSLEQAFARLALLVGQSADDETAPHVTGDTDSRSEDTGTIGFEEPYSANMRPGEGLPQQPEAHAPDRPT